MKMMIVAVCVIAVASAMPTGEPPKPPKPIMDLIGFCMKMVEKLADEQPKEDKRDFETVFEQLFPQCLKLVQGINAEEMRTGKRPEGSHDGDDESRPTDQPPIGKGDGRKGSRSGDDKDRPTGTPPMSKAERPTGKPSFEKREMAVKKAAKEFLGICEGLAEMAEKMIEERSLSDDEFLAIMMGVQSACVAAKTEAEAMKKMEKRKLSDDNNVYGPRREKKTNG